MTSRSTAEHRETADPGAADAVTATVSRAFAQVLGTPEEALTPDSDFFLLGGNSILGAQLVAVLRQDLPIRVTMRDLFRARTAGNLANALLARTRS